MTISGYCSCFWMVVRCSLLLWLVGGGWGVVIECRGHSDVFSTDRRNLILNARLIVG